MKKSLIALKNKYSDKIQYLDDETEYNDGYWIYLKDGYLFDQMTIIHEDTIAKLIKSMKKCYKSNKM